MQILNHVKGLRIQLEDHDFYSHSELRRLLGIPLMPLGDRSYLVERYLAHIVLEHFPAEHAIWEEALLSIVQQQSDRRKSQIRARVEVAYAVEHADQILANYSLRPRLDAHQREAVAAIAAPSLQGIAIFDEQGTGKTIMTLCGFDVLKRQGTIDKLLVIAPKSVLGSWRRDADMLFGATYKLVLVDGPSRRRREFILSSYDILVLNYETAYAEQALLSSILSADTIKVMMAVDESYYVKNADARRTRAVAHLRQYCSRAVVLCGTPAPNSALDVVQQVNIADEGLAFGRHAIPTDPTLARSAVSDALDDAIYLRRLKQDVLPDIPAKAVERITFDLQPRQSALYDALRHELIEDTRQATEEQFARQMTSFLARRTALLQICSHPGALEPTYDETPAKHLVLDDLLRRLVKDEGKKVVIWSYFRHSLEALAERYHDLGLVRIDGSVISTDARVEAIHRFQTDQSIRVFLGNAAAAGAGITLTAAHHAIYESFSNQAAHYMQSVDRIHRRGQVEDVTYHVLLAQGTIEIREFDRILEKERAGRDLLGDRYEEPITRERFLADLGATDASET